jgi:2,5-diketo-D-gluconate reductase B
LAYLLKKGLIVIPKASCIEHLKENFEVLSIELEDEVIEKMDNLPKNYRYNNPPFAPEWD